MRDLSWNRCAAAIVFVASCLAVTPSGAEEMTTYQFALMTSAPGARPLGEREIQSMQERHLAYFQQLFDDGTLVIEGPVDGAGAVRSVVVLAVPTKEAAEAVLSRDPWVASGRLVPEIHPWWAAAGILRKPERVLRQRVAYLGLLRRPVDAPEYDEAKLREIQAGHLDNIRRMAEAGDLVVAGPFGGDTRLRGVLVFRSTDPERLERLVAEDPAVKAGRLECDLHPWYIPEGVFP